ncbi:hypothetical protein [Schaalia cardiffensis]|nr:hypothetical protein [Schaalia cardiffensis]
MDTREGVARVVDHVAREERGDNQVLLVPTHTVVVDVGPQADEE